MEDKEKRNRQIGILTSIGMHVLLLVLFMFILAWREPDPPLPEYGIEINFGLQEEGSGNVQQETPVTEEAIEDEALPEESAAEDLVPEVTRETVVDETVEATDDPVEEIVENTQESPEVIEQKPAEEKPVQEEKVVEKPVEPEERIDRQQQGAKEDGAEKTPAQKSEGDDEDVQGDKGEPEGELNPDAVYKGKPGGGNNGPSLQIVGWMWDNAPDKKDDSNENGTITFEFTIDEDGYVINTRPIKRSVSPSVAKFYEEQLRNTTFSRTGTGVSKPGPTKGTVTFNIVSR